MASRKKMCCLCLNDSNLPLTDLFPKNDENSTHFEKISIYLLELATAINDLNCDRLVCKKCVETIEMIDNFNITCLENIKIYSSQKVRQKTKKEKRNSNVDVKHEDSNDVSNLMDICQVQIKIEEPHENSQGNWGDDRVSVKNEENNSDDCQENDDKDEVFKKQIIIDDNGKKRYCCSICKKTFGKNYDLTRHKMIHDGIKPYMCEICGRSFNRKKHLNDHMLVHNGDKTHGCEICSKKFRHKCALERHKQIHFGSKPVFCDICGKQFTQASSLMLHKRTHTGEKPYVCNLCGKAFAQKITLIGHRSVHTKEKPFSCEICHKRFTLKGTVGKHKRKVHKELIDPNEFQSTESKSTD